MNNKNWIQGFTYLKLTNSSWTTWLVPSLSASQLLLPEYTRSPHQARSRPFLEFTQEENGFLHKTKRMRDECFRNQPMFIFRKSIKKKNFFENLDVIFLEQASSKRKGNEEHKNGCHSLSSPEMGESSF